MPTSDSFEARVAQLNDRPFADGDFVLYWMQQSQRAVWNHALEYAIALANDRKEPLLAVFGLTDRYPDANLRHYTFMLEGLLETRETLARRGIRLLLRLGDPPRAALSVGRRASAIVCDRGYLKHQRHWRQQVAASAECPVIQVESDLVVPLATASEKTEYAARTIRPKIHRQLDRFLKPVDEIPLAVDSRDLSIEDDLPLTTVASVLDRLDIDQSVPAVSAFFRGGTSRAVAQLGDFIRSGLARYDENSNQPQTDDVSRMSPYLHFGQISPIYVALQISGAPTASKDAVDAYLEELIVRRELAANFVAYIENYDRYSCIPEWARRTLDTHRRDTREHQYSRKALDAAATHDPYWNAAMMEMRHTGFMHNYMRMYWGKKILEWSRSPETAFRSTLALNNRYFLDGRDPNSYTGVAWIYGIHDRAWPERPIFGKVRYMAASGLERKCDIRAYVEKVDALTRMG